MRKLILGLSLAALFASGARADFTGKDASGATITFKNSGVCTSVVCVAQFQPVDSTGAAFGVTGNPFFISFGTGVTLPAYASTPTFNLGTLNGAATASNQSSQITQETAINTVLGTQADTAWVSGSGTAISILKNIAGGVGGAIPAGSNLIGKVSIDQTTPNTTNAISVAQIAGTTTATGSGAMNGGTQRMAIATDSPGIITLGQTTMSASVPMAIASNQSANALWGQGATGSAPPANAQYVGVNASGATGGQMRGLIMCDNHVFKHITTATDTLAVQGVASQSIYICGWRARAAGVATWYLENTASANANCASTLTQITGVATEAANTGEVNNNPFWNGLKNTSGNGLCINSTGTGGVDVDIWYTQF
jgi:hypothetical protein